MRQVQPISDHMLIGDCHTAPSVSGGGSDDRLYLPRCGNRAVCATPLHALNSSVEGRRVASRAPRRNEVGDC